MILKQSPSQIQRAYQVSTGQQFIKHVLLINHHSQMLDNRYLRIFYQYFGCLMYPQTHDQIQARDKLILACQQQQMKKFYRMKEIVSTIRDSVLTRVKIDRIAPILVCNSAQYQIMHIVQRRNRAGYTHLPESNTMHTQSSSKNQKQKIVRVQKNILPSKWESIKDIPSKNSDISSQILSKVTQDLGKMIQSICIYDKKPMHQYSNLKFIKDATSKTDPLKKHFKRKLLLQNISMIRANTQENNFKIQMINFDEPEENYGLRKIKRKNIKSNELKSKHKKNYLSSQISKSKSKRKISEATKKQPTQRLHLSPLTPNPFSTTKSRQGWTDNFNKNSRFSLKTNLSRVLQKSNSGRLQKLSKSPLILKRSSPKTQLVQHKSPKISKKG